MIRSEAAETARSMMMENTTENMTDQHYNTNKTGASTTDSNNNIENTTMIKTDSNNNGIMMMSGNNEHEDNEQHHHQSENDTSSSSSSSSPSASSTLSQQQQQQQQQQQIKQELSEQEAQSFINDYCGEGGNNSRTNLIVNYLPQNMTQDEIKELFASIGPVESCKLIKDKLTGQSLGYAFVNYSNQDDADKAIYSLNGMRLQNKTIKVSLARPSSESIKGANLYICGLPKNFTQVELEKMFNEFGTIISSKILTDSKTGESKGVGFVRFDKRMEAESAIEKLNGKLYENIAEPLVVKFANSPTSVKSVMGIPLAPFIPTCRGFYQPYRSTSSSSYRYSPMNAPAPPPPPPPAPSAAYCPAPIDPTATLLHHHHHQHHHHAAVAALNGLNTTGLPPSAAAAAAAAAAAGLTTSSTNPLLAVASSNTTPNLQLPTTAATTTSPVNNNNNNINGQQQQQQQPPQSLSSHSLSSISYPGWCIFVYNLGPESDESLLWQLFGPFGAVQSVKVIRDMHTHKCKGFGFVTMTNYDEAVTAINCLNGLNLQNRILQVSFKTSVKTQPPMF